MVSEFLYGIRVNQVSMITNSRNEKYPTLVLLAGGHTREFTGTPEDMIKRVDRQLEALRAESRLIAREAKDDVSQATYNLKMLNQEIADAKQTLADLSKSKDELLQLEPETKDIVHIRDWLREKRQYLRSDERSALERILKAEGWL